jgi:hypothetical protein
VPEYFEGDCTLLSYETYVLDCCHCERANPRHIITTQYGHSIYFLRLDPKISIYHMSGPFDPASRSVSHYRQLEIGIALSLAVKGLSPTDALHQPVETGKERKMT